MQYILASGKESYSIPDGYYYTKDHEWLKAQSSPGRYLVGISDYASKMLHDIVYVNLPKIGASLKRKEVFGQVESVKTVSDVYMPISGKVLQVNEKLTQMPELVSSSPYVEGWMLEIESGSFKDESKDLLDAKGYRKFVSEIGE